ncbi:MAG: ABC transporter substrate-binding protein [Ramlibacter sp.]
MKRRVVIGMSGAAALGCGLPVFAQPTPRIYRIGVLSEAAPRPYVPAFEILRSLGYEEGRNLLVDFKFAQARSELLPGMAAELVAAKPDLLAGFSNPETIALKKATVTIPIVMMYGGTPVETGLIASLARPGGNITGTTMSASQTVGKMTQILREAVPRMWRVAWLGDASFPGMDLYIKAAEQAAAAFGLRMKHLFVHTATELDAALASLGADRPDAVGVATTGTILRNLGRVVDFVAQAQIPATYTLKISVPRGGLMSYGPDVIEIARRHAWMIDKILKGASPSDIPVEEPTKFELSINMKTARSLGLTIPRSLLMQADEVIE